MLEKSQLEGRLDQLEDAVFKRLERLEKIVKEKDLESAAQLGATITVRDPKGKSKRKRKKKSPAVAAPPSEKPQWVKNLTDIEWLTSRIGISLLLIGMVTMLYWLNEQRWVTDVTRLGAGYGVGAILLGIGVWLTEKRPSFGQLLVGAGISSGYMTTLWGAAILDTIPGVLALLIVSCLTILAYGFSVWKQQQVLAFIGLLFGLACPFFIRPENASMVSYIAYTCVILLGPIAIYTTLSWNHLFMLTSTLGWIIMIASSVLVESSYRFTYDERLAVQGGIIFACIGFGIVPVVKLVLERAKLDPAEILAERSRRLAAEEQQGANNNDPLEPEADVGSKRLLSWPDWMPLPLPLIVTSPLLAAAGLFMLWPDISSQLWATIMAVSGTVYLGTVYYFGRDARFQLLQFPLLVVGAVLLMIAPLQAETNFLSFFLIITSLQAASFTAFARREKRDVASYFASILFLFVGLGWSGMIWDGWTQGEINFQLIETPVFNLNFVAYLVLICSLIGASFLEKGRLKPLYAFVAHVIALISIGREIYMLDERTSYWLLFSVLLNLGVFAAGYFLNRRFLRLQVVPMVLCLVFAHIMYSLDGYLLFPHFMVLLFAGQIVAVWAVAKKDDDFLLIFGGNMLVIAGWVITVLHLIDFFAGSNAPAPFVSPTALSTLTMVISLLIVVVWYSSQRPMKWMIDAGTHLLALAWILAQCLEFAYVEAMITALWALYAVGLLVGGLVFDRTDIRNMSVGIIFLTLSKLILVDLDQVEIGGRVLLFSGFGVVLLTISYFTRTLWRKSDSVEDEAMIKADLEALMRKQEV